MKKHTQPSKARKSSISSNMPNINSNKNITRIKRANKKSTSSPVLEKAKEVIEDNNLYKLKYYLIKTGAIKG
jgi:hypothetical protein